MRAKRSHASCFSALAIDLKGQRFEVSAVQQQCFPENSGAMGTADVILLAYQSFTQ